MKSQLFTSFLTFLVVIFFSVQAVFASIQKESLPECIVTTHCVRVEWQVSDPLEAFSKVLKVVRNTPRTEVVEVSDSYIHAEATTKWMRYVDDLEIQVIPDKKIVQVRSESRVGIGDNGVNQKRIDELAYRLTTNQSI